MSNEAFQIQLAWQPAGKNFTYAEYSRDYSIETEGKPQIINSAAPEYQGSKDHYNPEELLVASLAGCHMLSYLALAANSKIHVLAYEDQSDGSLEKIAMSFKFKEVTLRPKVTIDADSDAEKAKALFEKAHKICFIANSVNFPVHVEPEILSQ